MFKVEQVAQRLNISRSKVYALVKSGELPHHKMGGAIRVTEDQLVEYLQATERRRKLVGPSQTKAAPTPSKSKPTEWF